MNRIFLIAFLGFLLFACKDCNTTDSDVIVIKIPEIGESRLMDMHEIIDTAIYIPLTTDDSVILDVNMLRRFEYYKGKFYCFIYTQGLYVFHADGSFCNKISFGRGPGELLMENSHKAFFIDKTNDRLVFPGWYKLHFYDLEGRFIATQDLKAKLVPPQVAIDEGQYWFYFFGDSPFNKKGDAFHFYQYDPEEGIQKVYLSASPLNKYAEGGFGTGSSILANSPLTNDTIYKIDKGNFSPLYYVEFGKNKFPDYLSGEVRYDVRNRRPEYAGIINNIVTNDTVLYFTFSHKQHRQEAYCFIHSGKVFTGSRHQKDSSLYIPFGKTMSYADGYFVSFADAYKFIRWAPEVATKLNLKEDDNPVAVLYKLKDDIK